MYVNTLCLWRNKNHGVIQFFYFRSKIYHLKKYSSESYFTREQLLNSLNQYSLLLRIIHSQRLECTEMNRFIH